MWAILASAQDKSGYFNYEGVFDLRIKIGVKFYEWVLYIFFSVYVNWVSLSTIILWY